MPHPVFQHQAEDHNPHAIFAKRLLKLRPATHDRSINFPTLQGFTDSVRGNGSEGPASRAAIETAAGILLAQFLVIRSQAEGDFS